MARREIKVPFKMEEGIVVEGAVKVLVTVRQGRGANAVELVKDMEHYLDFAGCSLNDLVDSAAANAVIELQNSVWRALDSEVLKAEAGKTTSMKERYERERTRTAPDPAKTLMNRIQSGKMSATEVAELVAQLTKLAGGVK